MRQGDLVTVNGKQVSGTLIVVSIEGASNKVMVMRMVNGYSTHDHYDIDDLAVIEPAFDESIADAKDYFFKQLHPDPPIPFHVKEVLDNYSLYTPDYAAKNANNLEKALLSYDFGSIDSLLQSISDSVEKMKAYEKAREIKKKIKAG